MTIVFVKITFYSCSRSVVWVVYRPARAHSCSSCPRSLHWCGSVNSWR